MASELTIISNTLEDPKSIFGSIQAENDNYEILIRSSSNYIEDKNSGNLMRAFVRVSAKNKNTTMYAPKIEGTGTNLSLVTPSVYVNEMDVDSFIQNINDAKDTLLQIKNLIEKLF